MGLLVTAQMNYQRTKSEYNQLSFEKMLNDKTLGQITAKLSTIKNSCSDENALKANSTYQQLVEYSDNYETSSENIATQLELKKGQMENLKSYMKESAKEATSLWCFG